MLKAFVFLNYTLVFVPFWLFFIKKKKCAEGIKNGNHGAPQPSPDSEEAWDRCSRCLRVGTLQPSSWFHIQSQCLLVVCPRVYYIISISLSFLITVDSMAQGNLGVYMRPCVYQLCISVTHRSPGLLITVINFCIPALQVDQVSLTSSFQGIFYPNSDILNLVLLSLVLKRRSDNGKQSCPQAPYNSRPCYMLSQRAVH